jgi:hypothetical protein
MRVSSNEKQVKMKAKVKAKLKPIAIRFFWMSVVHKRVVTPTHAFRIVYIRGPLLFPNIFIANGGIIDVGPPSHMIEKAAIKK